MLLDRPVEKESLINYKTALQKGKLNKFEIILQIIKSSEFKKNKSSRKVIVWRKILNKIFH